jgi:hypothetical protein
LCRHAQDRYRRWRWLGSRAKGNFAAEGCRSANQKTQSHAKSRKRAATIPGPSTTYLSVKFSALEITRWALILDRLIAPRVCIPDTGAAGRLSRGKCCTQARTLLGTLVLTPVRPLVLVLPPYATSHVASSLESRRPSRSMFSAELPIRHARPLCTGPSSILHSRRHLARGRRVHAITRNILDIPLGAMSVARWANFARCLAFDPATNASYVWRYRFPYRPL